MILIYQDQGLVINLDQCALIEKQDREAINEQTNEKCVLHTIVFVLPGGLMRPMVFSDAATRDEQFNLLAAEWRMRSASSVPSNAMRPTGLVRL